MHRNDAEHYVAIGRAAWLRNVGGTDDTLRLTDDHPRNRATRTAAAMDYDRAAAVLCTLAELRNLPIVRPQIALRDFSATSRAPYVGRSGPAYIDAAAFGKTGRTTDSGRTTLLMTSAELTTARTERLFASGKGRT